MEPQIRYAKTEDGVAIAYAVVGRGPPLLFARPFVNPGLDDEITGSTQLWPALTNSHTVVLWDPRGVGLSGSAPEARFDEWLADMDAVAAAAGADRFDLVGVQGPCHLLMGYAARMSGRVNRLVLHSPSIPGASPRRYQPWLFALAPEHWHDFVDMLALRLFGWDRAASAERWANRIRAHFTTEQFMRYMDAIESVDATRDAGSISTPTLVIDDRSAVIGGRHAPPQPPGQFVRELAAAIPGAHLAIIKEGETAVAEVVERFLAGGSPEAEARSEAPTGSGTAIILFADIVDSTALTEHMGDAAFRTKARDLDDALRAIIRDAGGAAIDGFLSGDGVLATFPVASQAIGAALRCGAAGDAQGLALHLGLHAGDVIREHNNVFGGAVNIAARISGLSAPGEVLVSDIVRGLARTSAGVTFEDRGEQALKGVSEPVRVYAVRRVGG